MPRVAYIFWDRLGQSSQVEVVKAEFNYVCLICAIKKYTKF
jgi:hypothetical protein